MLRTPSNNALDQNFIKFGAYVTVRCDLYGKNINMKSGNPSSTDPYHYDQFSELFSYCMAVGRGTVMAVPVFTATMLVLWPIGRLSRTHFHYHTDNCRTDFHGFPTALLCLVQKVFPSHTTARPTSESFLILTEVSRLIKIYLRSIMSQVRLHHLGLVASHIEVTDFWN